MSQIIFLVNEYPGILDLSSVSDVEGKRVVLQPKGMAGSERECFAEIEAHPHVVTFKTAGRLSIRRSDAALSAPAAPAPAAEPAPVVDTSVGAVPVAEAAPEPAAVEVAATESAAVSDTLDVQVTPAEAPAEAPSPPAAPVKRRR